MRKNTIFLILFAIVIVFSAMAQEWELPIEVYMHPDSVKDLIAKTSVYGSDMWDSARIVGGDTIEIDKPHPPAPPSGFYAFFPLDDPSFPYIDKLITDARSCGEDEIVWTIWWGGAGFDSVYASWDPADIPSGGTMQIAAVVVGTPDSLVDWSSAVDMSSTDVIGGHGAMNWFKMRYVFTPPDVDTIPPYFTNWSPADGAVDVPVSTDELCVDIMDAMSPIDESTISLNIAGIDVPSMFFDISPITDGVILCVNSTGLFTLPPGSTIVSIVCASDTAGNNACDTASFTVEDTLTPYYCVEGTVTLVGETDYSGSIVMLGAYHDTTDASGYYVICAPEGSYNMYAFQDGFTADSSDIDLDSDMTQNFTLSPTSGEISGIVELDGMSDYSGSIVTEIGSGINATTDASGAYLLEDVPLGAVTIVASHSGFTPDTVEMVLDSVLTDVDFYLFGVPVFYTVDGTITLEGETDYSGIEVILTNSISYTDTVSTPASGDYSFAMVEPGVYDLTASKSGFEDLDTSITVSADVSVDRELAIETGPTLNPPSNLQSTTRPCWAGAFNLVTWDPPMQADTVKLAHCSARGYGDTNWGGFSMYYGYGNIGGGYAMPFVAPSTGMDLVKVRMNIHPYSYGITTEINVWGEADSGGPGAVLYNEVVTLNDTVDGWAYIEIPALDVGTDLFYVGWIDQAASPNNVYCMYDYTSPDTLAWVHYSYDSSWSWEGTNVDMADGDFAIECYLDGGARSEEIIRPGREVYDRAKVRRPQAAINAEFNHNFKPAILEGPFVDLEDAEIARTRPAEAPTAYRLYRSTSSFTDTASATFVAELADTMPYYLDNDAIDDVIYYYGMVAVYSSGMSDLSNIAVGYNRNPPAGTNVLLVDWGGGRQIEEDLGWEWDPGDSLLELLENAGYTGDSVYITGEQERLYGYQFVDPTTEALDYELVVISWNPLSSSGFLGPRPRGPEWRKLSDYVRHGGNLMIEGADAMEILSADGYTTNQYDSLYSLFGVSFMDGGCNSLDSGNVRELDGVAPLFVPSIHVDYSLSGTSSRFIGDYGVDEFEHAMGSGGTTVLNSQLMSPMPHASTGRGVWNDGTVGGVSYKTYVQSVYLTAVIDLPGATKDMMMQEILEGFGMWDNISETKPGKPDFVTLNGNKPNPFNAATEISFELRVGEEVELSVYDMLGCKIKTLASGQFSAGSHSVIWDGTDNAGNQVESGVYFARIDVGSRVVSKRMFLLK